MALFKRKQKDSVLPEVDQYYQAERRDRSGLAWLLAIVSIAVVALVIVLLFLGGRWVYQQITNDDTAETPSSDTENQNGTDVPSVDGGPDSDQNTGDANNGNQGETTDEVTGDQNNNQGGTTDQNQGAGGQGSGTQGGTNTPSTPSTTPATGADGDLPSTGPGDMVAIFAGVSTVAGGTHYIVQRRKRATRS